MASAGTRLLRGAALLLAGLTVLATAPAHAEITGSDRLSARQVSYGTGQMYAAGPGLRESLAVASFNVCKCLTTGEARADVARLVSVAGLDVIGWQEAEAHPGAYDAIPGWTTVHDRRTPAKAHELAVSWRTSEFELVDHRYVRMHLGSSSTRGDDRPFPPRFVLEVRLRSTRSPEDVLTVYDTHVNQRIERWDDGARGVPYGNANADGARAHLRSFAQLLAERAADETRSRWAVVLGDLNWDYRADQRTLRPGFVEGRLGDWAVSSWEAMGIADRPYSHPRSKRWIDYVSLPLDAVAHFRKQSVRTGYHSDHRPVVAWLGLD